VTDGFNNLVRLPLLEPPGQLEIGNNIIAANASDAAAIVTRLVLEDNYPSPMFFAVVDDPCKCGGGNSFINCGIFEDGEGGKTPVRFAPVESSEKVLQRIVDDPRTLLLNSKTRFLTRTISILRGDGGDDRDRPENLSCFESI